MATHHQKLPFLDQPATHGEVLAMMQRVVQAFEARLIKAGIKPLSANESPVPPLLAHICEDEPCL